MAQTFDMSHAPFDRLSPAEAEVATLREQLAAIESNARAVESELSTLNKERDQVRLRVEKMLEQMDELL